jgi:hypothetical protein
MPEESYSFKPADPVRSFGQIIGHVADAPYQFCSTALGEKNPTPKIEETKLRRQISSPPQRRLAYCDKAYEGMTDASGMQLIKIFGGDRPKLSANCEQDPQL